jgi:hypothetical protein
MVHRKGHSWDVSERRYLERNRGIQPDAFSEAMKRAGTASEKEKVSVNPPGSDVWPRTPSSSDSDDPYSSQVKPKGVPVWNHPPATEAEEALYYGVHIHSESNPLGLHTHVPGGKLSGGHSHGPQNVFGGHHHRGNIPDMAMVDGNHTHDGKNYPNGSHEHCPENFG